MCGEIAGKMSEDIVWELFRENVLIPVHNYKYLRAAIMIVTPWLTHRQTQRQIAFDRLYINRSCNLLLITLLAQLS